MNIPYLRVLARQIIAHGHKQVAAEACKKGVPIETFLLDLILSKKGN